MDEETDQDKMEVVKKSLQKDIAQIAGDILKLEVENIDFNNPLLEYGFTSVTLVEFVNQINEKYEIEVKVESFFELEEPNIKKLSTHLLETAGEKLVNYYEKDSKLKE